MNRVQHEQNMRWAQAAIRHCRWTFVIGASNKHGDLARTGNWSGHSVGRLRKEMKGRRFADTGAWLAGLAGAAEAARAGNCGEQAAVAFQYLRDTFNARPLDYMVLNPTREAIHNHDAGVCDGDHVFVVIGRLGGSDANLKTWNLEAVACDPWAGVACPAYEYTRYGPCGAGWHPTQSYYRVP